MVSLMLGVAILRNYGMEMNIVFVKMVNMVRIVAENVKLGGSAAAAEQMVMALMDGALFATIVMFRKLVNASET